MSNKIIKNSFIVLLLIGLGKVLSFLRDIIISAKFGATSNTDAYFAANSIPSILFAAIISSYVIMLIPTYKKIQLKNGVEKANLFVSGLLNSFFIVAILLTLFGFIFIETLIYLVAPGLEVEAKKLAIFLGKILLLSFPFSSITLILATVSNANNKYVAPHIIPVFSSIFVIISVFLFSNQFGIVILAISGVIAYFIQFFIQIYLARNHFKYSIKTKIFDFEVRRMTWLVLPIFLGFSIDQINLLVNTMLASNLAEGNLSALNYAQRLQATITGTLSTAILTVVYPLISKLFLENDIIRLTSILKMALKSSFLILFPLIVFISFNSFDFVSIIYFRGKFSLDALDRTSSVFIFYAINVIFISLREIILRMYYIRDNTKMPLYTSALSLFINLLLSIILIKHIGLVGLSLANLIATIVSTIVLFTFIPKYTGILIKWANVLRGFYTLFIPLCLFVILQYVQSKYFQIHGNYIHFTLYFLISINIYFIILLASGQKEAKLLLSELKRKVNFSK